MSKQHRTAELTSLFFKAKAKLAALQAQHESAEAELKEQVKLVEELLIEQLHADGLTSVKVAEGTFGVSEKKVYKTDDIDSVRQFAVEAGEFGIFNMSLSLTGVREYIERNEGSLPPGVTEVVFDQAYNRPARTRASS